MQKNKAQSAGFSLLELMVVVAIIVTLTLIGIPSYQSYILRAHRSSAKLSLLSLAAQIENYYVQNNTYVGAETSLNLPTATPDGYYALSGSNLTAKTYTLDASAQNSQMRDSACLNFTLNQSGVQTPSNCWQ